jgi:hypothetical protein
VRFENGKKRFENEKELHDIKIAETRLKNVTAILSHPPASLSEAQLKRMREQEVFLTGVVTGVDMNEDLEPATSAQRRKVGEQFVRRSMNLLIGMNKLIPERNILYLTAKSHHRIN